MMLEALRYMAFVAPLLLVTCILWSDLRDAQIKRVTAESNLRALYQASLWVDHSPQHGVGLCAPGPLYLACRQAQDSERMEVYWSMDWEAAYVFDCVSDALYTGLRAPWWFNARQDIPEVWVFANKAEMQKALRCGGD